MQEKIHFVQMEYQQLLTAIPVDSLQGLLHNGDSYWLMGA